MISKKGFRWLAVVIVAGAIAGSSGASKAAAQIVPSFQLSGEFDTLHLTEFNSTTAGAGLNAKWNIVPGLAVDGVVSYFPQSWQTNTSTGSFIGQNLLLALGGVKPGVTFGRYEFFGRARAGVLDYLQQNDPFACLAIFPTPLQCQLAAGYAAFAMDFGGGVDIGLSEDGRLRVHAEVGDLMVRYGQESTRPDGAITTGFYGHNLLFTASLGWRF